MMNLKDAYEITACGKPEIVTKYYCPVCENQHSSVIECCGEEVVSLSDKERLNNEEIYHYAELIIERYKIQDRLNEIDSYLNDYDSFDSGY